jgi:colanic acid biosynthesis glycosyl transferase WcaI
MSAARPDLVLSFGGPPLVGPVISGLVARMRGVPLVTVIHDIYPDVAIESGALRNPIGIRIARWLERWQYSMSSAVVVLGETTRRLVVAAGGYPPDRVHVVPVWLDPDEIRPGPRDNGWRRSVGIRPDEFVVLYSGTAGIISGAEVLAKVAAHLPPDVVVVLVGGGSAWNTLDGLRTRGRLPGNLRLLPYQPRERLAEVQAASDLSVLTLLPGRGRTSVPSKLQGYMAAGRPVLIAADEDCDTAELVRKERIGRIAPPGDDRAFAKAIVEFRADRAELEACGRRARAAFEAMHARDPLLDRYSQLLREVVDEARKC